MSAPIEKIREALDVAHFPSSVPRSVLQDAIDELERLRRNETLAANYAEKERERAKREAEFLARIAELEAKS